MEYQNEYMYNELVEDDDDKGEDDGEEEDDDDDGEDKEINGDEVEKDTPTGQEEANDASEEGAMDEN